MGQALADVVREAGDGRLNLLLTDGETIAATRWGASLFYLSADNGVVVASEPHGPDDAWHEVPDRHVLVADHHQVEISPI
jgi:gamma-glutamyl hercynylcysteine S-oxide hydrolase